MNYFLKLCVLIPSYSHLFKLLNIGISLWNSFTEPGVELPSIYWFMFYVFKLYVLNRNLNSFDLGEVMYIADLLEKVHPNAKGVGIAPGYVHRTRKWVSWQTCRAISREISFCCLSYQSFFFPGKSIIDVFFSLHLTFLWSSKALLNPPKRKGKGQIKSY